MAVVRWRCLCDTVSATKLICLDCDSTLSAIEGIDELARLRGLAVLGRVEEMTNDAMEGRIPIESVFERRLELIEPRRGDLAAVGRKYIETVEPTAKVTIAALVASGWTVVVVSGGFTQAIQPLADYLGVTRIVAVELKFTAEGIYDGFDETAPTSRSGGKPEVIRQLKLEFRPDKIVMVGDGASDLETAPEVDLFVGFGRYITRANVKAGAKVFVQSLDELLRIL